MKPVKKINGPSDIWLASKSRAELTAGMTRPKCSAGIDRRCLDLRAGKKDTPAGVAFWPVKLQIN